MAEESCSLFGGWEVHTEKGYVMTFKGMSVTGPPKPHCLITHLTVNSSTEEVSTYMTSIDSPAPALAAKPERSEVGRGNLHVREETNSHNMSANLHTAPVYIHPINQQIYNF